MFEDGCTLLWLYRVHEEPFSIDSFFPHLNIPQAKIAKGRLWFTGHCPNCSMSGETS